MGSRAKPGDGAALCLLPFKSESFRYPKGLSVALWSFPCPKDIQYLDFLISPEVTDSQTLASLSVQPVFKETVALLVERAESVEAFCSSRN